MRGHELNSGLYLLPVKNRGRVETQPRFKIQYPMKNQNKDGGYSLNRCTGLLLFLKKYYGRLEYKKRSTFWSACYDVPSTQL